MRANRREKSLYWSTVAKLQSIPVAVRNNIVEAQTRSSPETVNSRCPRAESHYDESRSKRSGRKRKRKLCREEVEFMARIMALIDANGRHFEQTLKQFKVRKNLMRRECEYCSEIHECDCIDCDNSCLEARFEQLEESRESDDEDEISE